MKSLFDTNIEKRKWRQFHSSGYDTPVSGAIFDGDDPTCCGVPLGGLGTGCIDYDVRGIWGYNSVFNGYTEMKPGMHFLRSTPTLWPLFGISDKKQVWVLAAKKIIDGGNIEYCTEPLALRGGKENKKPNTVACFTIDGVKPAKKIHYFGHFPVADVEYETDGPYSVGVRAWSPFLPGRKIESNIPASVFEVHVRNISGQKAEGTLAFNFPGPSHAEAQSSSFYRQMVSDEGCDAIPSRIPLIGDNVIEEISNLLSYDTVKEKMNGVLISAADSDVSYVIACLTDKVRTGAGLNRAPQAWSRIDKCLPLSDEMELRGKKVSWTADASLAVDFQLDEGEEKVIRFILAWYAPDFIGSTKDTTRRDEFLAEPGPLRHTYRHMYAARYSSSLDVARRMAKEHEDLLKCVIKWQQYIYKSDNFPVWVRDQLVNSLNLIAEDSYWVQARPPIGDFAFPGGLFGLNESSRGCPHMECIGCSWYGNLPVVYFFPDLALSTLRAFKEYQLENGCVPFELGSGWTLPDFATPSYEWQVSINGIFYVVLVDRLWQSTRDDIILREFYESAKKCNTFTMNLNIEYAGVISMPTNGPKTEGFEFGEWDGMCSHMGGWRLAQLQIMERMAEKMADHEYALKCRKWFEEGSSAMEGDMWDERGFYLNYYNKENGKKSDDIMAYQLAGDWLSAYHGFNGVFDPERVKTALQTIKQINMSLTPKAGAANFARPDGNTLPEDSRIAFYGQYSMFTPEVMMLAMVYMIKGEWEFGLDFFKKLMENMVLVHGHGWDLPNSINGNSGERKFGTDYYQNLMFWALPATLLETDIAGLCKKGGFIDGILDAAVSDN